MDDLDGRAPDLRKKGGGRALPWLLVVLLLAGGGAFWQFLYQPAVEDLHRRESQAAELRKQVNAAQEEQRTLAKQLDDAHAKLTAAEADLQKSTVQKDADDKLIGQLKKELGGGENGDVAGAGGAITVTMVDKILFRSGEAELTPEGEAVLKRLGGVLQGSGKLVEVSGHADTTPVKSEIKALYPTNWELSAARATHVVRFLEEQVGLAPRTLKAAGYGSTRPVASNNTAAGRAKNRRIEILLLPDKLKVVKGELPQVAAAAPAPAAKKGAAAQPPMSDKERVKALTAAAKPAPAKPTTVAARTKTTKKK